MTTYRTETVYSVTVALCGAWSVWGSGSPVGRTRTNQRPGWQAAPRALLAAPNSACLMSVKSFDILCQALEVKSEISVAEKCFNRA